MPFMIQSFKDLSDKVKMLISFLERFSFPKFLEVAGLQARMDKKDEESAIANAKAKVLISL